MWSVFQVSDDLNLEYKESQVGIKLEIHYLVLAKELKGQLQ